MSAKCKVSVVVFAVAVAGCSANARFDLSGYEEANGRNQQSAAVTTPRSQPSYQGTEYGYQPTRNVIAPETASLGWNADKPEAGSENRVHVVREGDTLWGLAKQYRVPMTQLYSANGLVNDRLTPGQHLVIPKKTAAYDPTRVAGR